MWSFAFNSEVNHSEQLTTGYRQKQTYVECTCRRWQAILMRISRAHSGQRVSLTFFHFASNGLTSSQYSRRCRPRVGARELGQRARYRLGAGTQLLMSITGPRERVTRWRRSTRTSSPTGGSRQSGIIISILLLVGPPKIRVPNTAKSLVPGNLRFVDRGSNATSTSSWLKAFIRSPSPPAASEYGPVRLACTGGTISRLIAIMEYITNNHRDIRWKVTSLCFREHNMCKSQVNAFGVNIITSQCFLWSYTILFFENNPALISNPRLEKLRNTIEERWSTAAASRENN